MPSTAARAVTLALGLGVLALAWRRRSLGLALAAALCLSPIVWRHFFALLIVPLGLSRPRFDIAWLVPLGLWVGTGTFNGETWQTAAVLGFVALTFVLCELRPAPRTAPVPSGRGSLRGGSVRLTSDTGRMVALLSSSTPGLARTRPSGSTTAAGGEAPSVSLPFGGNVRGSNARGAFPLPSKEESTA